MALRETLVKLTEDLVAISSVSDDQAAANKRLRNTIFV